MPSTKVLSTVQNLTVDKIHHEMSKPLQNLRIIVLLCNMFDVHQAQIKLDESCPRSKSTYTDIPVLTSPGVDCQINIIQCFDQSSEEDEDDYSSVESWEEKEEEEWVDWDDATIHGVLEKDEQCTLSTQCKECHEEKWHVGARSAKVSETEAHMEAETQVHNPFSIWMMKSKYRLNTESTTLLTKENAIGETFSANDSDCPLSVQGALRMWREVVS
jgi:hypothetical protein